MTHSITFTASAPGTLMLAGEHAVLYGHPALVCAIDKRIFVELKPREDQRFSIHSESLGTLESSLSDIHIQTPFQFVTAVIQSLKDHITTGFDLFINSDFSHMLGLGSSSAVTVATLGAFSRWLNLDFSHRDIYERAYQIILHIQKNGSGADVAASTWGGLLFYRREPWQLEPLPYFPELSVIYSGSKKPTAEVIAFIKELAKEQPEAYQQYFEEIGKCVWEAKKAIEHKNPMELGSIFNQHYEIQKNMLLTTPEIENLIEKMEQDPNITGSKISGSGLGDCVIGIGKLTLTDLKTQALTLNISPHGIQYD